MNDPIKAKTTGYTTIHFWLSRRFGSPKSCANCGTEGKEVNGRWTIEFALKKGCSYEKELGNFIPLCTKCHRAYDRKVPLTCQLEGCTKKYFASQYCLTHYNRFYARKYRTKNREHVNKIWMRSYYKRKQAAL